MDAEFHIDRLGHQGDGIAQGPMFAPRTLPGETIRAHAEGDALTDIRVVTPSSDRVKPPCRHFKSCGGCQLQHASDSFVADWKQDVVSSALSAQGLNARIRPIITSPASSRRRATLSARRTKSGALAGFHTRASDAITQIPECQLLDRRLLAGIGAAEALALSGTSRKGEIAVTLTLCETGLDVSVKGGKPLAGSLRQSLAQIAEEHHLARLSWDEDVVALRETPYQNFDETRVVPPPGAFLQATKHGESALLKAVQEATHGASRLVDLFAGCGTFSLPLARNSEVLAVEGDAEMIHALDQGWRKANGLKQVSSQARDLFRRPLMSDELAPFDAVVLDPPRAGAEAQVAEIAASGVPRIAYVSCNPISFARDAKHLISAGFQLDWIQVVDQFRWSAHIELVACFSVNNRE